MTIEMNQRVYITRRFSFEACHHLPNYKGKCSNVHGHSYKLEVTVSAEKDFSSGAPNPYRNMVMDFSTLKGIVNAEVVNKYDHQDLNEFFTMPTAESMVVQMFEDIRSKLSDEYYGNVRLEEVKLWETEDSFASFRGDYV